jgi:GAF domain-containing protein
MVHNELGRRLADVARDVQSREDLAGAADEIVAVAAQMFDDDTAAGITLVHARRRVETAAATTDLVRRGDVLQYELDQGPCLDAAWRHRQVYSPDLANDQRWPTWGPQVAEELGVRTMLCTQLFTNEDQLGALNLYSQRPDAFDEEVRETALLLAAHAAVAVAAAQQIDSLKVAVDRRTTIGKALGILMERYDLDDDRAFSVLRRLSSDENRKVYDLAEELVTTRRHANTERHK